MLNKPAPTGAPINDLLTRRWSTRAFDAKRPVAAAELASLLEAARWAPSASNTQPWRFVVCNKATDPAAWQKAFDCLNAGNQAWCVNVPVLILSVAAEANAEGKKLTHNRHDTGAALFSIMLQATALGLSTHAMGGFSGDKARELFHVPEGYAPVVMTALGFQASPDVLAEDVKPKEMGKRTRRALGETFFSGDWGKPAA